jgi:polysaccharide export outer membrane protein
MAGGVGEYSKSDRIVVVRNENGKAVSHRFNYKDVEEGKNLQQNMELKPGDTIIVP